MTTLLIASSMYAQRPIPENTMVSETALFKREYPRVDKQKRGYFRLYAPKAQEVYLVCGKRYDMTRITTDGGMSPLLLWSLGFIFITIW